VEKFAVKTIRTVWWSRSVWWSAGCAGHCNRCFGGRGACLCTIPTNFKDVSLLLACHSTVGIELGPRPARLPSGR